MAKERIGLVGPGRMGLAMVRHLIKAGYPVTVTDLDAAAIKKAETLGAQSAATAADVARASKFVIIAVGFDDEALAVTSGKDGLMDGLQAGSIVAVSSTVAPDTAKKLDEIVRAKSSDILDAPICRGGWAADDGTLLALFGGKREVVERGRPVYSAFSSDIVHVGDVGHGQVAKTMNNMLLWVNGVALMEAGRLAQSTGIDLPKLREALMMSSGDSAALHDWDMITFTWALKDMQIVTQMTDKAGLALPITGAIKELVKEAKRLKSGGEAPDWTGKRPRN
ncbi:MAG TPA: NAD(P)-dependent oxidoreductase [Alphaproteobacteria bacterium]|jgi:3-hydroxyisobutyrate dehydrogenase/2-hydroxy-3-oxopropionate reductase|nr:NAD(P)-dependent oxidoreductase [Alphaproteobacteria bacterium]